jgi:uncharacterized protein (DUF1501 family)
MGPAWAQTTVLVATEFGRTAANGTGGTDHGTGSVAWVLGGAVKGGRVVADWPGLAPAQLYEGRDLATTNSTPCWRAAEESLGLDPALVAAAVSLAGTPRPISGSIVQITDEPKDGMGACYRSSHVRPETRACMNKHKRST